MGKYLHLIIASVILLSCSNDDSLGRTLIGYNKKAFVNGILHSNAYYQFERQRLKTITHYNSNNQQGETEYVLYGANGLIKEITVLLHGEYRTRYDFEYDHLNRIKRMSYICGFYGPCYDAYNMNYLYAGNTVTFSTTGSLQGYGRLFYINENNLIYKEERLAGPHSWNEYEVIFDNTDAISANLDNAVTTFEYLDNPIPEDFNPDAMYGSSNNIVLLNRGLQGAEHISALRFIKKVTSEGKVVDYEYIFSENGMPLNCKKYVNGVLTTEMAYYFK